jgi:hypothetical protein
VQAKHYVRIPLPLCGITFHYCADWTYMDAGAYECLNSGRGDGNLCPRQVDGSAIPPVERRRAQAGDVVRGEEHHG